jgi:hypothetical protein
MLHCIMRGIEISLAAFRFVLLISFSPVNDDGHVDCCPQVGFLSFLRYIVEKLEGRSYMDFTDTNYSGIWT